MVKFVLFIIIVLAFGGIFGESNSISAATANTGNQTAFAKELNQEVKIKDYALQGSQLIALLINDGTRRDGYAMYLCETARSHGVRNIKIIIMDAHKVVADNNGYKNYSWDEMTIGEVFCK